VRAEWGSSIARTIPKLQRAVAIKIVSGVSESSGRTQLLREARAASALNHPNICTIHEVDEVDGVAFIVMEYIVGKPLNRLIPPGGLPADTALRYGLQIAEALAHAHREGIVHRDVKTANVLITEGRAKVLDFGLAKRVPGEETDATSLQSSVTLTRPGRIRGTLAYMAPERLRGERASASSDVWSLGVLLHVMATGRQPFAGTTTAEVISAIMSEEPAPVLAETSFSIRAVIVRCLQKDPALRYQHAGEVRTALEVIDSTGAPRTQRWRQSKIGFASAAAISAALVGVLLWSTRGPAATLTDKDVLVLADFTNATSEPIFDVTLREALAAQLEQSPLLRVLSDAQVRQTLQSLGRSPDDRISDGVARDICIRRREKAMLAGSIASLGSSYAITLVATDCQSGETLAREQVEATGKERVLTSLSTAASRIRGRLGESLASIQKRDPPYPAGEATTASLEAFEAYARGNAHYRRGQYSLALPFYQRAVALDPNFAMALWAQSGAYGSTGDRPRVIASMQEAFAAIDRVQVSELERLLITAHYHMRVTGDLHRAAEVLDVLTQTYPRFSISIIDRASVYNSLGQLDNAIRSLKEAIRQEPAAVAYNNLLASYLSLERFDDAKAVARTAFAQHFDSASMHHNLLSIALMEGDRTAADKEIQHFAGTAREVNVLNELAVQAITLGQRGKARELFQRAAALAGARNRPELVAVLKEAAAADPYGDCQATGPLLSNPRPCADPQAQLKAVESALVERPADTILNSVELPRWRAIVELRRNRPDDAIALLAAAAPYEFRYPGSAYVRGQAYLRSGKAPEAAAEFQKIVNHKGITWGAWYSLAHVGLARAAARAGDSARAKKAYEDFLELWKGADEDIPILIEARKEYSALR
jgi:serine/threonine protein kinase/tetratricopeptide (TPR) repeat protein